MLKKGDIIIIACVTAVILISAAALFDPKAHGTTVTIKKDNEVLYEVSLSEECTLELDGNTVCIENGEVFMKHANCENQLCVKQGKISSAGEIIICLPHRVSVTVS